MAELNDDNVFESFRVLYAILGEIGLDQEFIESTLEGDDWSFVIKSHALLESSLNHSLLFLFNEKANIDKFIVSLPLHGLSSKISLLRSLGPLMSSKAKTFLQDFSQIRNQLAHDAQHTSFRFDGPMSNELKEEIDKCKRSALKLFLATMKWDSDKERMKNLNEAVKAEDIKSIIFSAIAVVVADTHYHVKYRKGFEDSENKLRYVLETIRKSIIRD